MGNAQLKILAHTPNGTKMVKAKKVGDGLIPLGCFYDDGELLFALRKMLFTSVMPLLYKIYFKILSDFNLKKSEVKLLLFTKNAYPKQDTNPISHTFESLRLDNILDFFSKLSMVLKTTTPHDFSLVMNIEATKPDNSTFGTQIEIILDDITYDDEQVENSWKIWHLNIESFYVNLEKSISKNKSKKIIKKVFDHLVFSYNNPE